MKENRIPDRLQISYFCPNCGDHGSVFADTEIAKSITIGKVKCGYCSSHLNRDVFLKKIDVKYLYEYEKGKREKIMEDDEDIAYWVCTECGDIGHVDGFRAQILREGKLSCQKCNTETKHVTVKELRKAQKEEATHSSKKVTAFCCLLLRDYFPAGVLEGIIEDALDFVKEEHPEEQHLLTLAQHFTKKLG